MEKLQYYMLHNAVLKPQSIIACRISVMRKTVITAWTLSQTHDNS